MTTDIEQNKLNMWQNLAYSLYIDAGHTTSYVLSSRITDPNLTTFYITYINDSLLKH